MKRLMVFIAVALTIGRAAVAVAAGEQAAKPQTTCPVSGEPIDKSVHVDWQGQRVYFCCNNCPAKFKADPEKYFAKFAAEGVELENIQTTCPVSGEELGGDMGKPVALRHKGRTVMLCCNMCKSKFEKNPEEYLAKLPGEQPPAK